MPPVAPSGRWKESTYLRWLLLLAVALLAVTIAYSLRRYAQLDVLAAKESRLRELQAAHPVLTYAGAFIIYVTVTGLSIPGATALSLLYGWFFGFLPALLLVSFASTTGATIAFLLSRYFFRAAVQRRLGDRLHGVMQAMERDGAFYLLTLRLIPQVPFFVVNVVMGLTPISTWSYWWVSQLGTLPGTAVYLYAASQVPNLQVLAQQGPRSILTPRMAIALALLGALPLTARGLLRLIRAARRRAHDSPKSTC